MNDDLVRWLADDVAVDLRGDRVGLYEFMWSLHTKAPELTTDDRRAISRAALATLLAEGGRHLRRERWAQDEEHDLPADYVVRDEDFDDIPDDGWYVAIVPYS